MAAASIVRSVDVLQMKSIDAWPRYCVMLLSDRVSTTDDMSRHTTVIHSVSLSSRWVLHYQRNVFSICRIICTLAGL